MIPQVRLNEDIWTEYRRTGDTELRNEILLSYVHIVKYIAQRMMPSYGRYLDFDDLMGYGIIGIMDAIEKFDTAKGVKFETYASLRVKGAIIDQLRKQDWVPRGIRSKVKDIKDCYETLEVQSGKPATDEQVAAHLNIGMDELHKTLDESYTFNVVSLDEQILDAIKWNNCLQEEGAGPEQHYEGKELKEILADYIDDLTEKERMVVTLYYFEELTLKEIGKVLGVSESRISQIHSKALIKLKAKLEKLVFPE